MLIDLGNSLWVSVAYALLVGVLLGIFYFAGLWWTVRRLGSSRVVAPLFLFSMLFRISVVMISFYLLLGKDWRWIVLGLLGFIMMRWFATRFVRLKGNPVEIKPILTIKDKSSHKGERN